MLNLIKTKKKDILHIGNILFSENKNYLKYFNPFTDENDLDLSFKDKNNIFYNICLSKEIIGFLMLRGLNLKQARFGIYLNSQYSHRGYSKKATVQFLQLLKDKYKVKEVYLKVHKENFKAINLYQDIEFEIKTEENESYIMKKKL